MKFFKNKSRYRSARNLYEYKIMRIGQFWRLKFYATFNYAILLPERFYLTQNLWREQDKAQKKEARLLRAACRAHYRGINLLVALYDALLNTSFVSTWVVSKPHTKGSSALDYIVNAQATSAHATQHTCMWACESDFESKQLTIPYSCLLSLTRMTLLKAEQPQQWVNS